MPRSTNRYDQRNKVFVICAYKDAKECGYLFWHHERKSKTLKVAHRGSSNIATWSSFQQAEDILNRQMPGRLITFKDNLESLGYYLEIQNFG